MVRQTCERPRETERQSARGAVEKREREEREF
jgi:hypothetical protein